MLRITTQVCFAILLLAGTIKAQMPQFQFSYYGNPNATLGSKGFTANNVGVKYQSIYYPSSFPAMPVGIVKAIYVRVGNNPYGANSANYPAFTVKIGNTGDSSYPYRPGDYDTFKTGLTTVYGPATFTATGTDSIGRWIRIPCNGAWKYLRESRFVVEFAMGPKNNMLGFDIMSTNLPYVPRMRYTIGGQRDSIRIYSSSGTYTEIMDIGFDIQGVGVSEQSVISAAGVFPNPATGGVFNISLEGKKPMDKVEVRVSNAVGQQVLQQYYEGIGTSLFKTIDGSSLAAGVYLVVIRAGDERITRRLSIQ